MVTVMIFSLSISRASLIAYDNEVCAVHSFRDHLAQAALVVRGDCRGVRDLETGTIYTSSRLLPAPQKRGDSARTRTAPPEYAFDLPIGPGRTVYLEVLR